MTKYDERVVLHIALKRREWENNLVAILLMLFVDCKIDELFAHMARNKHDRSCHPFVISG